jgi:hypothetical protein
MDTENKGVKGKGSRIWGCVLAIVGGLFMLIGIYFMVVFSLSGIPEFQHFLVIADFLLIGVLLLIISIILIFR